MKKHKCPNCGTETEVDFETNRRICKKCGWYGNIIGGTTSK